MSESANAVGLGFFKPRSFKSFPAVKADVWGPGGERGGPALSLRELSSGSTRAQILYQLWLPIPPHFRTPAEPGRPACPALLVPPSREGEWGCSIPVRCEGGSNEILGRRLGAKLASARFLEMR